MTRPMSEATPGRQSSDTPGSALRRMFLLDLSKQREELGAAQQCGDAAAVRALVHKLRAGCGFVGAARLGQAVESLQAAPLEAWSLRAFDSAADDTMSAQR